MRRQRAPITEDRRDVGESGGHASAGLSGRAALIEHAVNHSPAILYALADMADRPLTFISGNLRTLTGLDPSLFHQPPDYGRSRIHPDDRPAYLAALDGLAAGDQTQLEYRIKDAEGRYLWVRDHIKRSPAAGSEPASILGCMIDVTARKAAELSLATVERLKAEMATAAASEQLAAAQEQRRLSALLRDAVDGIPNGLCIYDPAEIMILCNKAFATFYGKPPTEMIGTSATQIHRMAVSRMDLIDGEPVENQDDWVERLLARLRAGDGVATEARLKDGRWIQFNTYLTGDGGRIFVRRDITDQKRAEIALRESEQLFQRMIEGHPLPVWLIEAASGKIVYESPSAAALVGRAWPSPEPHWVTDYYVDPSARGPYLEQLRRTGEIRDYEMEFKRIDGTRFSAAATSRLLTYKGQEFVLTANVDLTERKALEKRAAEQQEALHQSEKLNALGSLLAGVAHELNNPLLVVVGQALMLQETASDPAILKRAERIGAAAERCARIVKTFLQMARQQPPSRAVVDLDAVIDSALDLTTYALRSTDVEILRSRAGEPPSVWADRDQLVQVVMNLIINAQQAMMETPGRRQLTITTRPKKASRAIQLIIEDTGPGMPPEVRSRIFEPFFTTKPVGTGTGIGLAVTRGIVQAHGGVISVQSEPGWGTAFVITFPAAPAAGSPEAVSGKAEEATLRPCRVLVVDDEGDILMTLADILSADGHEVLTAKSGDEALALVGRDHFDAILTDIRMPGLDGPGLYKRLEIERPDLLSRVGFMTGDTLGPAARGFLDEAGRPCLEKPFTPHDARSLVNTLTEGHPLETGPRGRTQ